MARTGAAAEAGVARREEAGETGFYTVEEPTFVLALRPAPDLATRIVRCAQAVHRGLGPGLDPAAYGRALALELLADRLEFARDVLVEVRHRGSLVGKRQVSFILEQAAVDLLAGPPIEQAALRARAVVLARLRPLGLAVNVGGTFQYACRNSDIAGDEPEPEPDD
ncbi:MAG TPA: GxxExxY protein [Myxococcales bacterium]|jgi:GxxExxY protein